MAPIIPNQSKGFGEYNLPAGMDYADFIHTQKSHYMGMMILHGIVATSLVVAAVVSITAFPLMILLSLPSLFFVRNCARNYLLHRSVQSLAPPSQSFNLSPERFGLPKLGLPSRAEYKAKVCNDSTESNELKLEMIRHAEHNIFLSGSYCGGEIFDQALDLIEQRMEALPHLPCFILSSEQFLTKQNRDKMEALKRNYPDRFFYQIFSEKHSTVNPQDLDWMISGIHTKVCLIDYGKFFITGGSGLESKWYGDNPEKHSSFVPALFPSNMSDADFVFHSASDRGIGATLYLEMIKLFAMFDSLKEPDYQKRTEIPAYANVSFPSSPIETTIPSIEGLMSHENIEITPFLSGPEQNSNPFLERLIQRIDRSSSSILIDHMYFHPSDALLDALARASKRGVKVSIVTNDFGDGSPNTHAFFASLSKERGRQLLLSGDKDNISFQTYVKKGTTNHKKIMVIDNQYSFVGSSNICYRSDKTDYELNLEVNSYSFAEDTSDIFYRDQRASVVPKEFVNCTVVTSFLSKWKGSFQEFFFSHIL